MTYEYRQMKQLEEKIKTYKKFRFLKQTNNYNCAPIAMLNLYKWAGVKKTYKDIDEIKRRLKYNKGVGVYRTNEIKMLNYMIDKKIITNEECYYGNQNIINKLEKHINDDFCSFVSISRMEKGHAFLIVGQTKNDFIMVNGIRQTLHYYSKSLFSKMNEYDADTNMFFILGRYKK